MSEYTGIYVKKKQNAEYVRILNVSDAVHSVRSLHITEQLSRQTYSEHCQTFNLSVLQKE